MERGQQWVQPHLPGLGSYQDALPGMENPQRTIKEPHQMSPTEFISHPDTLYHSSIRPNIDAFEGDYGSDADPSPFLLERRLHAGTELAALQRAHQHMPYQNSGASSDDEDYGTDEPYYDYAHIHAVHVPKNDFDNRTTTPVSDTTANSDRETKNKNLYYNNDFEDTSSLSVVANKAHGNEVPAYTHSDYVAQAIANGKGHEVHPTTMAMYNSGALSRPLDTLRWTDINSTLTNPKRTTFDAHYGGGLFPNEVADAAQSSIPPFKRHHIRYAAENATSQSESLQPHEQIVRDLGPDVTNSDQETSKRLATGPKNVRGNPSEQGIGFEWKGREPRMNL